jgi:hypothetical protein
MARALYRPAVRKIGDTEPFIQSKMLFPSEEAAMPEAHRLKMEWIPRYLGELEVVLLVEVDDEGSAT